MPGELDRPPTRSELNRELMVRAATAWDGLAALVIVAGAGVVLGLPVLIVVAVVLWLAASVWHYFDGSEADKLAASRAARRARVAAAARLDPATMCVPVARELTRARAQEESIRQTIEESELPSELTADVDALVSAFEATARRADIIYRTIERQQENGQGAAGGGAARPLLHDDGADGRRARDDRLGDPRHVGVGGGVVATAGGGSAARPARARERARRRHAAVAGRDAGAVGSGAWKPPLTHAR